MQVKQTPDSSIPGGGGLKLKTGRDARPALKLPLALNSASRAKNRANATL